MTAPRPYYEDDLVRLFLGDCRELTEWAVVGGALVTDPPYGQNYNRRRGTWSMPGDRPADIAGDGDTVLRDQILELWGVARPAIVFGSFALPEPGGVAKRLVYRKPTDAGTHGAVAGFRHDIEAVYLLGRWPTRIDGELSSVLDTGARMIGGAVGPAARYGHPHAKPVDVCEVLVGRTPPGAIIADPCAGAGSILIAARNLGRQAIGVELDRRYCDKAVERLRQPVLFPGSLEGDPPGRTVAEAEALWSAIEGADD